MIEFPFDCVADTSAVIASLRDPELPPLRDVRYALAFVSCAELWLGVLKATDPAKAAAQLSPWVTNRTMLSPNPLTPALYALAVKQLQDQGQMIPVNDLWIAILAIQAGVPLLARDEHFARVPGLHLIRV